MCMVNLVVIVAYVCPDGANAYRFAGQVLVPLTSLNVHMKADVKSLRAAPLHNLKLLSDNDCISFVFFVYLIDGDADA